MFNEYGSVPDSDWNYWLITPDMFTIIEPVEPPKPVELAKVPGWDVSIDKYDDESRWWFVASKGGTNITSQSYPTRDAAVKAWNDLRI